MAFVFSFSKKPVPEQASGILRTEDINNTFATTGVALVAGANDIVNLAARTDKTSPIYGMPIKEPAAA